MTKAIDRVASLRAGSAVGGVSLVNPSAQMRKDLEDVCRWYETGLGWTAEQTRRLRDDYQDALQREPFEQIESALAKSGEQSRRSLRDFWERVSVMARKAA